MPVRGPAESPDYRKSDSTGWRYTGTKRGGTPPTMVLYVCEKKYETAWSDFTHYSSPDMGSDEAYLMGGARDQQRMLRGETGGCTWVSQTLRTSMLTVNISKPGSAEEAGRAIQLHRQIRLGVPCRRLCAACIRL